MQAFHNDQLVLFHLQVLQGNLDQKPPGFDPRSLLTQLGSASNPVFLYQTFTIIYLNEISKQKIYVQNSRGFLFIFPFHKISICITHNKFQFDFGRTTHISPRKRCIPLTYYDDIL